MTRTNIFNTLAGIASSLALVICAAYFYSAYLELPYLSYRNLPFNASAKAAPGERVEMTVERCSSSSSTESYSTTHSLRNEATLQIDLLPSIELTVRPGCHRETSKINIVPEKQAPGFYSFSGKATVRGLLVNHVVGWNSETFEVVEKTKGDKP